MIKELKSIDNETMYNLRNREGNSAFTQVDTIDENKNCWKYNADNSVEINSTSVAAGLFVIPFYNVKQGDVIEASCEVYHVSGDTIRMGVDIFTPSKNTLSYVKNGKTNQYETLSIKITVPVDAEEIHVSLGAWGPIAVRGLIRNFRSIHKTKRQPSKPFRHVNITNRNSADGSFELTSGRSNDPATIVEDTDTITITFDEELEFVGSSFTNQEYFGDAPDYIVRTSFARTNELRIRFFDLSGNQVALGSLPKTIHVGVLLV